MFDCPVCHISHDEPAEAVLGVHVPCIDCYFDGASLDASSAEEVPLAA